MELISVIIPVYNTAEYLPRCLDSILTNTYTNLEIICVNDGSTDNSENILLDYQAKDSRVVVISQENAGVSAARNAGLDHATGDFVAFIDSDDWVHKEYFALLYKGILENVADVVICSAFETDVIVEDAGIIKSDIQFHFISPSQVADDEKLRTRIWGRLYRSQLIRDKRFAPNVKLAEDTIFNLDAICSKRNTRVVACDCRLYYYFIRWESAVHTLRGKELEPAINWFLGRVQRTSQESSELDCIYIREALKRIYAWRYDAMVSHKTEELGRIKVLLRSTMEKFRAMKGITCKERIVYTVFSAVPFSYRFFRIMQDPTLITWEKNTKEKLRNNK